MGKYFEDVDLETAYDPYNPYDPHDTIVLVYDEDSNRFIDGHFGNVIHDIHRLLAPWQITLFKAQNDCCVFPDVTNSFLVELDYLPF